MIGASGSASGGREGRGEGQGAELGWGIQALFYSTLITEYHKTSVVTSNSKITVRSLILRKIGN